MPDPKKGDTVLLHHKTNSGKSLASPATITAVIGQEKAPAKLDLECQDTKLGKFSSVPSVHDPNAAAHRADGVCWSIPPKEEADDSQESDGGGESGGEGSQEGAQGSGGAKGKTKG